MSEEFDWKAFTPTLRGDPPQKGDRDRPIYGLYALLEFLEAADNAGHKYVPYIAARAFVRRFHNPADPRDRPIRYAYRLGMVEVLNKNKQASKRVYITQSIGKCVLVVYRAYFADQAR